MKLQVALDTLTLDECVHLLEEIRGDTDIAEVGTPFIIEEGMRPVRELKAFEKVFLQPGEFWRMPKSWTRGNTKRKSVSAPARIL